MNLFEHRRTKIVGCQVSEDLSRLQSDFNINIDFKSKAIELTRMALSRGVSISSRSLDSVSKAVIGISVPKVCQRSNWDTVNLTQMQKKYVAKDAYCSLERYEVLKDLPDFTVPPKTNEIVGGFPVDIAPYLSNTAIFNKRMFCSSWYHCL